MNRLRVDQWAYSLAVGLVIAGGFLVVIGRWVETIDRAREIEDQS